MDVGKHPSGHSRAYLELLLLLVLSPLIYLAVSSLGMVAPGAELYCAALVAALGGVSFTLRGHAGTCQHPWP